MGLWLRDLLQWLQSSESKSAETVDDQEARERIAHLKGETLKLAAESRKIELEAQKIKLERKKLNSDLSNAKTYLRLERLKALGGFGTFFVGAGAVLALVFSIYTYRVDSQRKAADGVSLLFRDFGSEKASIRASAAIALGSHVTDPQLGARVVGNLVLLLAFEEEPQVQRAIAEAIKPTPMLAQEHLRGLLVKVRPEVEKLFTELSVREQRGQDTQTLARQITARQNALVLAALTMSDLQCGTSRAPDCVPNFSKLPLKRFQFSRQSGELSRANFRETTLWSADLFEADLVGADLTGAWLNSADMRGARLGGARFVNVHMEKIIEREKSAPLARFERADLKDAVFDGACLSGADFRGALNLRPEQFAKAFTAGAIFDPPFNEELRRHNFVQGDTRCRTF